MFAAEELRTSVTSGQYRRLEQSFTAIDVRNAMFDWPYAADGAVNANHNQRSHSRPAHKLTNRAHRGEECISFVLMLYIN